jgi:hypothetical protein
MPRARLFPMCIDFLSGNPIRNPSDVYLCDCETIDDSHHCPSAPQSSNPSYNAIEYFYTNAIPMQC